MKKLFTLTVAALSALAANAQLPVSTQVSLKNAILEEFTGIHCVYCPDGHKIAAQITAANPNRAFAVNIHTGGYATPSAGEPDFRTADGHAIAAIPGMGITGYPQGAVSRHVFSGSAMAMSRSIWNSSVNTILNQTAYVNVAGEATLNATTNELIVNIEAYYTANSPTSTNKLTVMLLQNEINGPQTGASQFNPAMVNPDGTYRHMHALRDVITSGAATGEDITTTTTGSLVQRTINYTIPASYANVPTDLANMEVLVFVAQSSTEIINVARVPITFVGLTTTNNAAVVSIEPIDDICVNTYSPTFKLKNNGNAPLTSAAISYSVNGGTASVYNWSGNLTSLSTQDVTLPAITFTLNPSNTLDVTITSVNGGTDDDMSDNSGTENFNKTTSESPTVNLTLKVVQDRYGDEITWKFFNDAGAQVAAGGPYAQLASNGTLLHTHNIVLPASGCYRYEVYDSYGDGINAGYGAGNITILDGYGAQVYYNNGVYTTGAERNFDVTGNVNTGIKENEFVQNVNIYPNPVTESAKIDFSLSEANNVIVRITNALGQTVNAVNLGKLSTGSHTYTIDATELSSGLYFVELEVGNSTLTNKISVSK